MLRARRSIVAATIVILLAWLLGQGCVWSQVGSRGPQWLRSSPEWACVRFVGGPSAVAVGPRDAQSSLQLAMSASLFCSASYLDALDNVTQAPVCTPARTSGCRRPLSCVSIYDQSSSDVRSDSRVTHSPSLICNAPAPTTTPWTIDGLIALAGNATFDVEVASDNTFYHGKKYPMTFREFVTKALSASEDVVESDVQGLRARGGPRYYLAEQDVNRSAVLAASVEGSPLVDEAAVQKTQLWVGGGAQMSRLHCDGWDNVLWQVSGCRDIYLWPPAVGAMAFYPTQRDRYFASVPTFVSLLQLVGVLNVSGPHKYSSTRATSATGSDVRSCGAQEFRGTRAFHPAEEDAKRVAEVPWHTSEVDDDSGQSVCDDVVNNDEEWAGTFCVPLGRMVDKWIAQRGNGEEVNVVEVRRVRSLLDSYPRLRDCAPVPTVVRVCGGEAAIIPAYWWHEVHHHASVNVALNIWAVPSRLGEASIEAVLPGGGFVLSSD